MSLVVMAGIGRTVRLPTGDPLQILTGVDLTIEDGEHVAIIGRSGSGKSTLLNLIGLLDSPTDGEYLLDGAPVARLGGRRRSELRGRTFGFVFQQFNLLPRRTATENVCVPLMYARGAQFWQRRRLAREVLDQVGLGARLDAMPEKLSGGEQQRVAIARALVRSPRIILADEPTGALDVDTGAVVMDLLEDVCRQRGATLVTITHDLAVAARAQRQYRLDHGVISTVTPGSGVSDREGGQHDVRETIALTPRPTTGIPQADVQVPAAVAAVQVPAATAAIQPAAATAASQPAAATAAIEPATRRRLFSRPGWLRRRPEPVDSASSEVSVPQAEAESGDEAVSGNEPPPPAPAAVPIAAPAAVPIAAPAAVPTVVAPSVGVVLTKAVVADQDDSLADEVYALGEQS